MSDDADSGDEKKDSFSAAEEEGSAPPIMRASNGEDDGGAADADHESNCDFVPAASPAIGPIDPRINDATDPARMTFLGVKSSSNVASATSSNDGDTESLIQPPPTAPARHPRMPYEWDAEAPMEDDLATALLPPPPPPQQRPNRTSSSSSSSNQSYTGPWNFAMQGLEALQRRYLTRENRVALRRFIRNFGNYLASLSLLTMLVVVPIVLYRTLSNRELDRAAYNSSIVMVTGTIVLSVRLVYLHLTHWWMPDVQKYIVRILWMVPIYSLQSYWSLRYHQARIYMSTVRDFYESYVIASFVYYLMELLGGQEALVQLLREKDPALGQHSFPFSLFLEPWQLGTEFMLQCKHGVLQYVVFKTMATIITFVCEFAGVYGEGRFSWFVAYPYLCFFQNISVMYALYCLVILYHAVADELRHPVDWRPLGKFLCIKGVVFFTWWQGVVIFYLRDHGIIDDMGSWSSVDVANGLIDYCIVIEMVGFAIAHSYTFTYTEYLPGRLPEASTPDEHDNSNPQVPNGSDIDNSNTDGGTISRSQSLSYRPPATLHQPMKFRDAFWSSTVPKETLEDIQRLRSGLIDGTLNHARSAGNRRRSLSLDEIQLDEQNRPSGNNDNDDVEDPLLAPPPADDALTRAQTMHL